MVKKCFVPFTYVNGLTESISKQSEYFAPTTKICSKPYFTNNSLFTKLKQKIDHFESCNCVYEINCKQCEAKYYGESVQKLSKRIGQHKTNVKDAVIRNQKPATALAKHCKDNGHKFKFKNAKIMCREKTKFRLRRQEVNYIMKNENVACNFKTDIKNNCAVYYTLIGKNNKKKKQQQLATLSQPTLLTATLELSNDITT